MSSSPVHSLERDFLFLLHIQPVFAFEKVIVRGFDIDRYVPGKFFPVRWQYLIPERVVFLGGDEGDVPVQVTGKELQA